MARQYSFFLAGGPELRFTVAYPVSSTSTRDNVYEYRAKRTDMNKWLNAKFVLNSNWKEEQVNNFLDIIEVDGGPLKIEPFELKIKLPLDLGTVEGKISWHNDDDIISRTTLERDYIRAAGCRETQCFGDGFKMNFSWTEYSI